MPPAGEAPSRRGGRREGGRKECFVMNSRHQFLLLKSLWLDVGRLAFAVNLPQTFTSPVLRGTSRHHSFTSAGMTGRTRIIMSVNLRRHSSCQFHGVRTGNGMQRDLFPPRLERRFVFFVRRGRRLFLAQSATLPSALTPRPKNFTGGR